MLTYILQEGFVGLSSFDYAIAYGNLLSSILLLSYHSVIFISMLGYGYQQPMGKDCMFAHVILETSTIMFFVHY